MFLSSNASDPLDIYCWGYNLKQCSNFPYKIAVHTEMVVPFYGFDTRKKLILDVSTIKIH